MQNVILSPIDLNELESLILKTVRAALAELQPAQQPPEYFSLEEAARFLHLKPATVYGLIHRRQIPYYKKRGRIYFRPEEISNWLNASRRMTLDEVSKAAIEAIQR